MSVAATEIKDLFKIKIKPRHDSYSDQYNRIFMVKILLACTIVLGISWYKDKFNCVVPDSQSSSEDFYSFVSTTCWVQGIYVYRELKEKIELVVYYGVPKDVSDNGVIDGKYLCDAKKPNQLINSNLKCIPMTKSFFLQYQYMPFFICALALLYYLPYMISKTVNHDLINLREAIKKNETDIDGIVKYYFKDRKQRGKCSKMLTAKQIANIGVKVAYIAVNLVSFLCTDSIFHGKFRKYGSEWIQWGKSNNTLAFNYMGKRGFPKPGNQFLPPFGLCEVYTSAKHVVETHNNVHVVLCEMSQHILYQYVFMLLWFAMITGIVVSIIGLVNLLINYVIGLVGIRRLRLHHTSKRILDDLSYREIEYLEFMRNKDQLLYGEVIDRLKKQFDNPPLMKKD